ncbi:MAG: monofunctional biosynthetic peptidoglycan transglycosylase [Daejeonella sp.]|uniref:monofunctional biosynthetic peptidoglycan transglycosylase n=1 Tax=Daejeonella sp. TaxID=2805397 RepID=UPI0027337EAD|nr:monofunctional biosynthetic peptidoglycan transglycosylase [Daejeonella sp.]MDP3469474.1 monofunctional biosynthetic peptidoglycan transglycosylase [Daejeonella sp.]
MNTFKIIIGLIQKVIFWFLAISLVWVLIYRFINPPITYLMLQRAVERKFEGKELRIDKSWLRIEDISDNLKKAAIAGEDVNFLNHRGFDFKAMETAFEKNQKGKKVRGGSTISQQTAKNVFLWPGRSYIRKAFEAYFTVLIELLWGKERILEVYLNVIEMGDGIYGAEAAVQNYWGKSANSMSKSQAALLVAVLPNPLRWNPTRPTRFVYYKQGLILRNMRALKKLPF